MYQNASHCFEYLFSFPVNRLGIIEKQNMLNFQDRQIEYTVNSPFSRVSSSQLRYARSLNAILGFDHDGGVE